MTRKTSDGFVWKWKSQAYQVARCAIGRGYAASVDGFTYRGLGIHLEMEGSPKGRRKPRWNLSHLGSGHLVTSINAHRSEAFAIATEIAEAGDWEFDSFAGMGDRFPNARDEVERILASHGRERLATNAQPSEDLARSIALSRW